MTGEIKLFDSNRIFRKKITLDANNDLVVYDEQGNLEVPPTFASAVVEKPEYDPDHVYAWKPAENYKGWKLIARGEAGEDDAEVIQKAVDTVSKLKGRLFIKSGIYSIAKPINLPSDFYGCQIKGEDWNNTVLKATESIDAVITKGTGGPHRVTIEDIRINCNNFANKGINLYTSENSIQMRLQRIQVANSLQEAINLDGCEDSLLADSLIENCSIALHWHVPGGNIWLENTYMAGKVYLRAQHIKCSGVTIYGATEIKGEGVVNFDETYFGNSYLMDTSYAYVLKLSGSLISLQDDTKSFIQGKYNYVEIDSCTIQNFTGKLFKATPWTPYSIAVIKNTNLMSGVVLEDADNSIPIYIDPTVRFDRLETIPTLYNNLAPNPLFELWSGGMPVGYSTGAESGSVSQVTDRLTGSYAVQLEATEAGFHIECGIPYSNLQGKWVTFGAWIKTSDSNINVALYAFSSSKGIVGYFSNNHPADGKWHLLIKRAKLPSDMYLNLSFQPCRVNVVDNSAIVDSCFLIEGTHLPFIPIPRPVLNYVAESIYGNKTFQNRLTAKDIVIPTSAPDNPVAGSMYFDTSTGKLYIYDGSAWKSVSLT